ncbi:MAG: hypothetical protein ACUVRZ_07710 [Desulfobacca sp.]|uniref:hypothetical protein n=1 Tax=Desulfobacca sp. TaxID=2067990 RepID=UPI00404A3081
MSHFTDEDCQELLALARSESFREEMRRLSRRQGGRRAMAPDRFLAWLQAYHDFINHQRRPVKRMLEGQMRL